MKNSIEEDIKILEEKMNKELNFLIENANKTEQLTAISIIAMKEPIILLFLSILSDYKRVLKENEEWQKAYQEEKDKQFELLRKIEKMAEEYLTNNPGMAEYLNNNYIHKRKIKDKIEELNNVSNAENLEYILFRKNYTIAELVQYVLQELIEEREEK